MCISNLVLLFTKIAGRTSLPEVVFRSFFLVIILRNPFILCLRVQCLEANFAFIFPSSLLFVEEGSNFESRSVSWAQPGLSLRTLWRGCRRGEGRISVTSTLHAECGSCRCDALATCRATIGGLLY